MATEISIQSNFAMYILQRYLIFFILACFGLSSCSDAPTTNSVHPKHPPAKSKQITRQTPKISGERKNVFIIVADALRRDALGCYGGTAQTPNLDLLAEEGLLFENSYSTSPWTTPSSVSIFTGNYPTSYKTFPYDKTVRISVPDTEVLLAEIVNELGYKTVKYVENPNAALHNNLQGFSNLTTDGLDQEKGAGKKVVWPQKYGDFLGDIYPWPIYLPLYSWVEQIMEMGTDDNFFFVQWFLDPHAPYMPPNPFFEKIIVDHSKLKHNQKKYERPLHRSQGDYNDEELRYNKALYLAEIESIDERVGILINALKKNDKLNNTYIIFTSDHGEQFGEKNLAGHGGFGRGVNYYEPLVQVPLIIRGPGIKGGRRVKNPVSLISLMPTIKELLGVVYHSNMQGESIAPLLLGKPFAQKPLYFADVAQNLQKDALIDGSYKLITASNSADEYELFDLTDDPQEQSNLYSQHPKQAESMLRHLDEWRKMNGKRLGENSRAPKDKKRQSGTEKKQIIQQLKELGYMK